MLNMFAVIFVAASYAFAMGWVYRKFARYRRAGLEPPTWLAKLERLREYLASEPSARFSMVRPPDSDSEAPRCPP